MGCRTEPVAVHIAHESQRLHFFQFFNFLNTLHDLPQKELDALTAKNEIIFFIISKTYHKKKLHAFTAKKIHDETIFLYTTYILHHTVATGKEGARKIKELQEAFVFVKEDRGPHN